MSKTRGDVANRALSILNAVGSGQTAAAEDVTLVDGLLNGVLDELQRRRVVYVGDPGIAGQMATGAFRESEYSLIALSLAKAAAPDFGKVGQDLTDAYSMATDGENRLRAMQEVDDDIDEPIRYSSV